MDPFLGDLMTDDILIRDGSIVEVGASIDAHDAVEIDASNMIAMPGLSTAMP